MKREIISAYSQQHDKGKVIYMSDFPINQEHMTSTKGWCYVHVLLIRWVLSTPGSTHLPNVLHVLHMWLSHVEILHIYTSY